MPHLIDIENPGPFSQAGKYIVETVTAGEFLAHGWAQRVNTMSDDAIKPFDSFLDWNDRELLIERPGGFGDLLFLTPILAQLKELWPRISITISCLPRFNPILHNNLAVATLQPYPLPSYLWSTYDAHIWLEGYIENNPKAETVHPIDLLAERFGIEVTDKAMRYFTTEEELEVARSLFPRSDKKRIGVQLQASAINRSYPHLEALIHGLYHAGHEVYMFGAEGSLATHPSWERDGLVNLTSKSLSFRQSCAVLTTCDALVAPDSALAHIASALNIPCIALYGPFPWQIRTCYSPKTKALTGHCEISPCFFHASPTKGDFPEGQPCAVSRRCEALAKIPPDRIVLEVGKVL